MLTFVATTTRGAEPVLADELRALGMNAVDEDRGAVRFKGELEAGYRACLWLRSASRVLLVLDKFDARTSQALYEGCLRIDWTDHVGRDSTIAVDFTGTSAAVRNSHFGALRVKDAVVDRIRDSAGWRPHVDVKRADVRINAHLRGDFATLAIDLSGRPLHQRDYRRDGGPAPLKETLAAAMLGMAGWPGEDPGARPFADPFCGSGTLLVEATLAALDRAPGRLRRRWGFQGWRPHQPQLWDDLLAEADARADAASIRPVVAYGSDIDADQLDRARACAERAGVAKHIRLQRQPMTSASAPAGSAGLLVTNPPYGERLGEHAELRPLYRDLGNTLRRQWLGWDAWVLTAAPSLAKAVGLRASKRIPVFNGPMECRLLNYPISAAAPEGRGPSWRE